MTEWREVQPGTDITDLMPVFRQGIGQIVLTSMVHGLAATVEGNLEIRQHRATYQHSSVLELGSTPGAIAEGWGLAGLTHTHYSDGTPIAGVGTRFDMHYVKPGEVHFSNVAALETDPVTEPVPVAWLTQSKLTGQVEQAEPNEKASNPAHWTDAFPVYREKPNQLK